MGQARRRAEGGTYIQPRGKEFYRGHVLEKTLVSLAGVPFWRVDVKPIGCATAKPQAFLQARTDKASLAKLVSEAKGLVGHIIHEGADVPATSVREGYMAGKTTLDAFVMRSSTGKPSICLKHWTSVELGAKAGTVNVIVVGILLMRRFTSKLYSEGMLTDPNAISKAYTVNMLLDSYAPLCCWLGDAEFATILADANPTVLLERARAKGVL